MGWHGLAGLCGTWQSSCEPSKANQGSAEPSRANQRVACHSGDEQIAMRAHQGLEEPTKAAHGLEDA